MSPKETAYIVERLAVRFMAMVAEYERKLLEHRDSFGARTSADARIIEGMRAELQEARRNACLPGESLNEAITRTDRELDTAREQRDSIQVERDALRAEVADLRGIVDMVHASLGIKQGDHIGKAIEALKAQTPTRSHPVKVGEYVKNDNGDVCQVHEVYAEEYLLNTGWTWAFENCTPCDPPTASHDTPAGKETAQAAAEPKPGDVVRLVREPSADTVGDTLKNSLDWPWESRWGCVGDRGEVVVSVGTMPGARSVRIMNTGVKVWWPLSCIEVVRGGDK